MLITNILVNYVNITSKFMFNLYKYNLLYFVSMHK